MKKKLITAIALSLCFCSVFSACGKKDEATTPAPDTTVATTEDKPAANADTPVAVTDTTATATSDTSVAVDVTDTTATATSDTSVAVAVGTAVAKDITADMTDEQREFYNSLLDLGGQALQTKEFLAEGISMDELSGGAFESEEEYIRGVCQYSAGSISNAERQEKATEVFTNHFWEIADNYDSVGCIYPDWETLYNEYASGSTVTNATHEVSITESVASLGVANETIFDEDGVQITLTDVKVENENLLAFYFKVVNNSDNKRVSAEITTPCINGFTPVPTGTNCSLLAGDTEVLKLSIGTNMIDTIWNAYGETISSAPIETIGVYYTTRIGSSSDSVNHYTEIKTSYYNGGTSMYGTKVGSCESQFAGLSHESVSVTIDCYRKDVNNGIVITAVAPTDVLNCYGDIMVFCKGNNLGYVGGSGWVKHGTAYVEISTEDNLRRENEVGSSEPLELRLVIANALDSNMNNEITIVE